MNKNKFFKWFARVGAIAFTIYFLDETLFMVIEENTPFLMLWDIFFMGILFSLPLVPLYYYGWRKE